MLGSGERNLKMIREALGVQVTARDDTVRLSGEPEAVRAAGGVLEHLRERSPTDLSRSEMREMIDRFAKGDRAGPVGPTLVGGNTISWEGELEVSAAGRRVRPRTDNQETYLEAIRTSDLVFGVGPAGTGKTYLAVAAAVHLLLQHRVRRLVLVRPAVEAGEKLGFLPGDMEAKVNPYLRPLLDALHDMLDAPTLRRFMETDVIEIAPLGFMRGRTLNGSAVILDEAQNTTRAQMQMFLTRMGHGTKMIVTGDVTQIDLPRPADSGLIDALRRLRRVEGVGIVGLDELDVVRHQLVQRVIRAYAADRTEPGPDADR